MAEEVEIDQEVYDRLIAEGKSERIARAKAKAAAVRKQKAAAGEKTGPRDPEEQKAAAAAAQQADGGAAGGQQAAAVATAEPPSDRRLTPAERAQRVQASLGNGGQAPKLQTREEHTHRLLAMIPPEGIQQVSSKQQDKVYTWPHLFLIEFVALLAVTALLLVLSYFIDPTFRTLANPNITPNPSKAPWYFLGLQEMLAYFHPMIAGVTVPGIGLLGLAAFGYLDKNPSMHPEARKFANMFFTFFMVGATWLTVFGSFFRGPGFNFVWPWLEGLFFEL